MSQSDGYQRALDYLYSFVDFSRTHQRDLSPADFDLAHMSALVEALGNPHLDYTTIHVAGTKGKGSVCALCASALQAQGYEVGLYTSPHLKDFSERIQINGVPIDEGAFVDLIEEIKPYVSANAPLSTFEIQTALAFWHFSRQKVDVAIIEVGLGGRLDSTNVVQPLVAVITSLSLDHTYFLGDTLEQIAAEKAGIIKPGVPVVLSPQKEAADAVVAKIAAERGSPLTRVAVDYQYTAESHGLAGQAFSLRRQDEGEEARLEIPLLGDHQVENAATAYATLRVADEVGLAVGEEAIRQGFANVKWPARFELLRRDPPVIVDAAHNPHSAVALRRTLDQYFPDLPIVLIFGASEDKDIDGMFAELLPRVEMVIATHSNHPRAMEPEEIVERVRHYERPAKAVPVPAEALEEALRLAGQESAVLATGSIFAAASVRIAWFERSADDPDES